MNKKQLARFYNLVQSNAARIYAETELDETPPLWVKYKVNVRLPMEVGGPEGIGRLELYLRHMGDRKNIQMDEVHILMQDNQILRKDLPRHSRLQKMLLAILGEDKTHEYGCDLSLGTPEIVRNIITEPLKRELEKKSE